MNEHIIRNFVLFSTSVHQKMAHLSDVIISIVIISYTLSYTEVGSKLRQMAPFTTLLRSTCLLIHRHYSVH